jgi:glycosyltransferase involved in cell wall biosynthesis
MKIILAVHHFPPHYTGGAEWEAYHMAAALIARGHAVKVVCIEDVNQGSSDGVTWVDELFDGIPVRRLSFNRAFIPDPVRWEYDNPWIGQHFDRLFDEFKPDIFHLISGYLMSGRPIWVAHSHGIPSLVSLEDFWFLCPRITMLRSDGKLSTLPIDPYVCASCLAGEKRRFKVLNQVAPAVMQSYLHLQKSKAQGIEARTRFLTKTLHKVDRLIVRSKFLSSTYVKAGAPAEKMVFSRQGLDFPTRPALDVQKTANQPLRVGYLGQIAWHKGIHVLLEAVRRIPDARLEVKIFGNSERFPGFTAQLKRLMAGDERITLAGSYNGYEDESRVLRDLDVVVVPSLWYENSPNVILEAFAQRVPVIASDLGGMAEMVQHDNNGLLFKVGSPEDLAHQLQRLCIEPGLQPGLQAGIRPIKTVSEEIDELERTYQDLLAQENAFQPSIEQVVR